MLDEKELLILSELRKNSRQSLAEISRKTNIPISTVFDKLIKLDKLIIKKNVSLFNFDKMGYGIKVNFIVKCKKKQEIKDFLLNKTNVNSVYGINNGSDFIIECLFKTMCELELFKEELADFGIEDLKEHHIIEEIKREDFLTQQTHIKMAMGNKENIFP